MSAQNATKPTLTPLAFWRLKLRQLLHDPPGKPFYFRLPKGHKLGSAVLLEALLDRSVTGKITTRPDRVMTGADRAVLPYNGMRSNTRGMLPPQLFSKETDRRLTHPLCSGPLLQPGSPGDLTPQERNDLLEDSIDATSDLQLADQEWNDPELLRKAYFRIWRRLRESLSGLTPNDSKQPAKGNLLWERMPADTRQPDHAIWEHNRLTAAVAFMNAPMVRNTPKAHENPETHEHPEQSGGSPSAPWLLTLSLGPVQEFISESRKLQDLWISSMMLADLFMHTLAPLVKAYGPDCILYPDLHGNPHMDRWMLHQDWLQEGHVLSEGANPSTFAGILPNTCVAVVPRGEAHPDSALRPLEELAKACQESMKARWNQLAAEVKQAFAEMVPNGSGDAWQTSWDQQHAAGRLHVVWSAVSWPLERARHAPLKLVGALPGQNRELLRAMAGHPDPIKRKADEELERKRSERLSPWMSTDVWSHYQLAREVFGQTELGFLQNERGFDYALTQHQLVLRHALRKQAGRTAALQMEPGEKCSLCHHRAALTGKVSRTSSAANAEQKGPKASSEQLREEVTALWKELDPDKTGAERLCAICATKRWLIKTNPKKLDFNTLWMGHPTASTGDSSGAPERAPFPSSTALCTQAFLEAICEQPELHPYLLRVAAAFEKTGAPKTAQPESLPRLKRLHDRYPALRRFLSIEPQQSLTPEASQTQITRLTEAEGVPWHQLKAAVTELRDKAKALELPAPSFGYAVIRMDGDKVSQLLLGDPAILKAQWQDVLHPEVVKRIKGEKTSESSATENTPETSTTENTPETSATENTSQPEPQETRARPTWKSLGWTNLLGQPRLMGPSLHAFISHTLADFSHRIVPWVVEREFDGRLIYAGGDDILAVAPAGQALALVARLQQLYSCAWVIDRHYLPDAWGWRRRIWGEADDGTLSEQPQLRFAGVNGLMTFDERRTTNQEAIQLPVDEAQLIEPILCPDRTVTQRKPQRAEGVMLPMMGPHHSLSAAITFANHKTPLSELLNHSKKLLDTEAKKKSGPGSVAMARYSRSGVKEVVALPWRQPQRSPKETIELKLPFSNANSGYEAYPLLTALSSAFEDKRSEWSLPGTFPFKLRSLVRLHAPLLERLLLNEQRSFDELATLWRSRETAPETRQAQLVTGSQAQPSFEEAADRRRYLAGLELRPPKPDSDVATLPTLQEYLRRLLLEAGEGGIMVKPSDPQTPASSPSEGAIELDALLYLWLEGLQRLLPQLTRPGASVEAVLERSLDVFLLARALAGSEEEDAE